MCVQYVHVNGVVFRRVSDGMKEKKLQIVIPAVLRETFLFYAHNNPMSSHLGKFKTQMRLLDLYIGPALTDEQMTEGTVRCAMCANNTNHQHRKPQECCRVYLSVSLDT